MELKDFIGRKVSILLEGKSNKLESYSGIMQEVHEGNIVLNTNNPDFEIEYLIIDKRIIRSVWVYKEAI